MPRSLPAVIALLALALSLFGGLPGAHWCALAQAAARSVASEGPAAQVAGHDCCPERPEAAATDGPVLCEGDCCELDSTLARVQPPAPPLAPQDFLVQPAPAVLSATLPRPPSRPLLAADRPRGPPPDSSQAPPWLRHRALRL